MFGKLTVLVLLAAALAGCSTTTHKDGTKHEYVDSASKESPILCIGESTPRPEQSSCKSTDTDRRRALLQKVEECRETEPQSQPALTGDQLKKHLESVQRDAIRKGLPPLPLPLTLEMDAQRVKEGSLPPQ
jgi:hypothetical protein